MKPIKVEITGRSAGLAYWYQIGEVHEVVQSRNENQYQLKSKKEYTIEKSDCKIISKTK